MLQNITNTFAFKLKDYDEFEKQTCFFQIRSLFLKQQNMDSLKKPKTKHYLMCSQT